MKNSRTSGILYAVSAYLLWGFTPLYWKLFPGRLPVELMAHRVFWSFFVAIVFIAAAGKFGDFRKIITNRKRVLLAALRAVFLITNWYTYIWAISSGRVLEASLGYYLNPLVSIFLGLFFLKERLNSLQWAAVGFAAVGVAIKTILVGSFPFVSIILAFSFGTYGLLKKKSGEGSVVGLGMESLVLIPFSSIAVVFLEASGNGGFLASGILMKLLYVTTGIVTILPLVFFSKGTNRIPLTWIGFLQFLAPTMMLIFGIFVYGEAFTRFELTGFALVWCGVILFIISAFKRQKN